jgi:small subunit ribosomal protein S18
MAFNKADKADAPMRKKGGMRRRKKVCVFCGKDNVIDYKDVNKEIRIRERQDSSQKNHR